MPTRSIIVPKITVNDIDGAGFASRIADAESALTQRGCTGVTVAQSYDGEGNVVACKVTGLHADDETND